MRRILKRAWLVAALCLFVAAPSVAEEAPKEDGTAAAPFIIRSEEDLRRIDTAPGAYYRLDERLELSGNWRPLCAEKPFEGTLDGAGRTISGLDVKSQESAGLFARIGESGRVVNLRLSGKIAVDSGTRAAGSLAGFSEGTVTQVYSSVTLEIADDSRSETPVGGIVGVGGVTAFCEFSGEIRQSESSRATLTPGAILGRTKPGARRAVPTLFTAHAGFAAAGGARDGSEDNTLRNIVKAIRFHPDVVEVDVRDYRGELIIAHNAPRDGVAPTLETTLRLLMGELPEELSEEEFNVDDARRVKIQLDSKQDGLVPHELELVEKIGFPLNRVIMAGDSSYDTILKERDVIVNAVGQGMEFWMNPDRIDTYDDMRALSDAFLEKIRTLGIPGVTVNSWYGAVTPDVEEWLLANGLKYSLWTLNDEKALKGALLRGAHNVTSRLPEALRAREECASRGVYGNVYDAERFREIGVEPAPVDGQTSEEDSGA